MKRGLISLAVLFLLLLSCRTEKCLAAEWTAEETTEKTDTENAAGTDTGTETADRLLDELELSQVQGMLDEMLGEQSFSMKETLAKLVKGEKVLSGESIRELLYRCFFAQMEKEKGLFVRLLLLVLLAAIFADFAAAFDSGQIGDICFYLVYLLLFILLMDAFTDMSLSLQQTLSWMTEFMRGLAPAYFLTVSVSAGTATASVFYEGVLILTWMIQCLIRQIFLPGAGLYVMLSLVNHLSREEMLGKMAELIDTAVRWGLKTLLGAAVGLQVIRNLVAPVMDTLKRGMLGRAAGALPGVGNAVNMVTELVLTSAVLVRNSLGVVILLAFVAIGAGPVLHYGILSLAYRFLAAVAQPVSDKRIVESLTAMGEGCVLLLKVIFTAEILCMLDFLILMTGLGGKV
ncbi:stage III sporulation protein AE [Blautia sp. MSJ-19]|uniref:stage III sporulation protein AE n=1 Tax=Blautia sp. MSJ-19 TaxID=2841517 RepID=UPI001C0EB7F9|nr:stage III sporulation protein AE [Blautia sp. MSJ-19]MBU5480854.1 stage III sporulation protein AE [Blautia sp. MSJ-19]